MEIYRVIVLCDSYQMSLPVSLFIVLTISEWNAIHFTRRPSLFCAGNTCLLQLWKPIIECHI